MMSRVGATVQAVVGHVRILADRIAIRYDAVAIAELLGLPCTAEELASVDLGAPVTLARSGRAVRLVHEGGAGDQDGDPAL